MKNQFVAHSENMAVTAFTVVYWETFMTDTIAEERGQGLPKGPLEVRT